MDRKQWVLFYGIFFVALVVVAILFQTFMSIDVHPAYIFFTVLLLHLIYVTWQMEKNIFSYFFIGVAVYFLLANTYLEFMSPSILLNNINKIVVLIIILVSIGIYVKNMMENKKRQKQIIDEALNSEVKEAEIKTEEN